MKRRRIEQKARRENKRKEREREREGGRGEEKDDAELAERVPGDAYYSYLAKCIKTVVPSSLAILY